MPTLVLAGGHLPLCSSMNLDACADSQRETLQRQWLQQEALFERHYDPNQLAGVSSEDRALLTPEQFERITVVVARLPKRRYGEAAWRHALRDMNANLDEDSELWLREQLEQPSLTSTGQRRQEAFSVAATDPDVRAVFERFLVLASGGAARKPRIGLLTSAAREPLDAAAYYAAWFHLLGADVVWLPLDGASRALRDRAEPFDAPDQPCANLLVERHRQTGLPLHRQGEPALWQQYCAGSDLKPLLQTLDGVFFNGGDQTLHLQALLRADGSDSPELALIRARFDAGELVLMGTSAGTAVQSGRGDQTLAMISNGSSASALREPARAVTPPLPFCRLGNRCPVPWHDGQLSYRPQGGLRHFDAGILDTHFSERGRMARLLMLLADTGALSGAGTGAANIGVGVDETTAVIARRAGRGWQLDVVGKHGAWLAAVQGSREALTAETHYLHRGDHALLQAGRIDSNLAACSGPTPPLPAPPAIEAIETGIGIHQQARLLDGVERTIRSADGRVWRFGAGRDFRRCPKPDGAVSYRGLRLELTQTSASASP